MRNKLLVAVTGLIQRDKWIKVLCFILAFFAWQGIRSNTGFEVLVPDVAVEVNVPEGWSVWDKSMHQVNILFRGSREEVRYLDANQLRVVVPVNNPPHGGVVRVRLTEKLLKNPTGSDVVRFSPAEIIIRLDKEIEKQLPVKAALEGRPLNGIEVEKVSCTPASVQVVGAEQLLNDMESIQTEPISLKGRNVNFTQSVSLELPATHRVRVDPDWVSVGLELVERTLTRELFDVPVRLLTRPGTEQRIYEVEPKTVTLHLKGKPERLEKLAPSSVMAYIECFDLEEEAGYDLPVKLNLPAGVQMIKSEPSQLHVEVLAR